jgi:hypothetical protein
VLAAPVMVQLQPDFMEGVELTLENACGTLSGYYKQQSQLKKWDINFELTELDSELLELLTGVSLLEVGPETVGHQFSRVGSCDPYDLNGVSIELWSKRWDNCQTPSDGDLYWHWALARAFLQIGDIKFENDFMTIPVKGYLEENPNYGDGPWHDFPTGTLDSIAAVWQDTTLPTPECGYVSVPA